MSRVTTNLFEGNVSDVSFDAAVPTLNPTELGGGAGNLAFSTGPMSRPQVHRNKTVILSNGDKWLAGGRVSDITWGPHQSTSFQAETALQRLNVTTSIKPSYLVTETAAMNAALASAGFTAQGLATAGTVIFPGWAGTLLDYIKHFCNAFKKEYYVAGDNADVLVFRSLRANTSDSSRDGEQYWVNDQAVAQSVEIIQYAYTAPTTSYDNIEFMPAGEDDPQIISINAGETVVNDIRINGWVASLNQPIVTLGVGPEARTDTGAYQVLGSNGLPVAPNEWTAQGGSLTASLTDDPSVIRVSITAPDALEISGSDGDTRFSPYSIAVGYGDVTEPALHITGKGVRFKATTHRVLTGVKESISSEPVGATIDNPFVSTEEMAWDVGLRGAQFYSGAKQGMTFSMPDSAPIEDVLGALVPGGTTNYRVDTVSYTGSQYSVSCTGLSTFEDFDSVWDSATFGDFDSAWPGASVEYFDVMPLVK